MRPSSKSDDQKERNGAHQRRWRSFRLGDKLTLVNGAAFKPTDWTPDGLPIVRIQNLNNPAAPYNHFAGQRPEKFKLHGGELLFAWSGTPGTSFGAHVWRGEEAWLNQHIFKVLFDDTEWDKRFLQFAINQNLDQYIRAAHGGAGLAHITKGRFEDSELPCPALAHQREIVAEISKQFTRLDAGVSALRRVQANLRRYRASVLKAACEGRLVPTEAELATREGRVAESGQDLLRAVLETRRQVWTGRGVYKGPEKPTARGSLPDGWTWARLEQLGFTVGGLTKNPKRTKLERRLPYLRVANVYANALRLDEVAHIGVADAELPKLRLQTGDLLVVEGNGSKEQIGRVAMWDGSIDPCVHQNHLIRFRPILPVLSKWLLFWLLSPQGREIIESVASSAAGLYTLSVNRVSDLAVAIPPIAEQLRIVAEIERQLSTIDRVQIAVVASLQRAANLQQSVLHQAFTGQLVTDRPQTPNAPLQPADARRPNKHFARAVLSAEIVHQLHDQPTFGRVKHQKILHLCEHIAQIGEIEGQYHREAAGPLDNKMIFANEGELKKQKWYTTVSRKGYGHAYQPMLKAGGHRVYLERYWPEKLAQIERLIKLMRKWDTDRCEILSTTYAAWNDLLIWNREPTSEAILNEILNRWSPTKQRFSSERWLRAIVWMKTEGLAPTGFGRPTCLPE